MLRKKRPITLLEIMIVIFIIGLIGSFIGINMKKSIDKARAFATQQNINQVHDILLMAVAEGEDIDKVVSKPYVYIKKSALAKNPKKMMKDGWGKELRIKLKKKDDFQITSEGLQAYLAKNEKEEKKAIKESKQYEE